MNNNARIFNKIMSVVLALVMVLSMLPMSVFAAEATQTDHDVGEQTAAVETTADEGSEIPTEGYELTIRNADGSEGMTIDGTKSASDFCLKSAIEDARAFTNNAFLFGLTTPCTYVVEMYEDSYEDESFEIGADVTINGNGFKIVCAEGVEVTNNGSLNDAEIVGSAPAAPAVELNAQTVAGTITFEPVTGDSLSYVLGRLEISSNLFPLAGGISIVEIDVSTDVVEVEPVTVKYSTVISGTGSVSGTIVVAEGGVLKIESTVGTDNLTVTDAEGNEMVKGEDGTFAPAPAKLIEVTDAEGNVTYLENFRGFNTSNVSIKLLADVGDYNLNLNKATGVVLDLNGYTFSKQINLNNGAELTIKDSSDAKTGKVIVDKETNDTYAAVIIMRGTLTVEGGTIETTGTTGAIQASLATLNIEGGKIVSQGNGVELGTWAVSNTKYPNTVTMTGGEIEAAGKGIVDSDKCVGTTVSIEGGVINSTGDSLSITTGTAAVTGGTFSTDVSAYAADGFEVKANADGTYGVAPAAPAGLSGTGTEADPFLVTNIDELKWFRDAVNGGSTYDNQFVKLTADVDLNGESWTPIGNATNKFLGTFDGDGHTISDLVVDVDTNNAGLFGFASVIKNVTIDNATVSGVVCVGALVGELESTVGTVDNCHVTGIIKITGENSVGGLAGKGYANIKNCSVDGTAAETSFVKGAAGTTEEGDNVGGIIGHLGEGNTLGVANSTARNITVSGTRKVGGIVGTIARGNDLVGNTAENLTVECTATADYAADNASTTTIGGIVGNYFGSATSGGILQDSTVTNVTLVPGNATSAGALVGGDRENNGGAPDGVEASGSTVTNVTGATNSYLLPVAAKIGDVEYATLADAAAAAEAGDEIELIADVTLTEELTLPAGITLNGNGKQINGSIVAGGDLTFKGHTKVTNFNAGYSKPTIIIGAGACLELTGTDRMVIGHGATFNITGTVTDAKTADMATLTPSLIMPGASFTGAGVTFNVTNAYLKFTAYCSSKNSNASGTFNFNVTNSIWEQTGNLQFSVPTNGKDPTVNFTLKDSVLTTTQHVIFGVSKGEIVIDNSNVNVGTSRQIENRSTMTVKNGSVVNGDVATSENAKNPGTLIVENATYAVAGEFSGSDLGTGTLIVKSGATFSAGSITKANIKIDATGMKAGDEVNVTANLSKFAGTVEVMNNGALGAEIVDGKIVLTEKPVAEVNGVKYATLEEAFKAATDGCTIEILSDVTVDYKWDSRYTGAKFTVPVTINGNGHTLTFTGVVNDGYNYYSAFRFEADAVVKNLTVDMTNAQSEFQGRFRAISAKANLTVDGCTFIGNGSGNNTRAIIFGEGGTADSLANVTISVTDSVFTGWRQAIGDNESGKTEVKTVIITGSTMTNAGVNVSASDTITFTGNTVTSNYVKLVSYAANNTLNVTATGNTLTANADTNRNCNYTNAGGEVNVQDEFVRPVTYLAEMDGEQYETVAAALEAAKTADMTDVVITLIGETTKESAAALEDCFDLYDQTAFNSVTLKQDDASKAYYIAGLYTGSRTNGGVFVFDGVNVVVTDQYIFEGNVKLTNNSVVKSTAEANCFQCYSTTVEPGSKLYGVIDDFRGGDVTVDGGKTDGSYSTEPDMQDAILIVNWSGDSLTLKNGAYVKVNSANEVGRLTVNAGADLNVYDSKLDSWQWIDVQGTLNTDVGSIITTKKITGAGKIVIDATGCEGEGVQVITADMAGFTGTVEVINGTYEITDTGIVVKKAPAVAKIGDVEYASIQAAIDAAEAGDTVILLNDVELTEGIIVAADKVVTLDLNGKTISRNTEAAVGTAAVTNNGTLTIQDSGTGGKITAFAANPDTAEIPDYASNTITNCGVLTVKGGTIENSTGDNARAAFPIDNNSTSRDAIVNIEGGTVSGRGAIRQFANSTTYANEVNITGGTVSGSSYAVWVQNPGSGDPKAELNISDDAVVGKILLSPSANFEPAISGGTVDEVAIWDADTANPERNPSGFITGGIFKKTFADEPLAEGYAALPDLNGCYVVGEAPTAIVNASGATVVPETEYGVWDGSFTEGSGDMPLSFVMQFLAVQDEDDMATSPFAEWYGDFVLTFTGIENGSFDTDGCYLAGYYGDWGWIKVPVEGVLDSVEEGVRYPVMLGVGLGQKYDYICTGVKDFRCALYLTDEILAANPDLQVKLELSVVDNSKGGDAAANALASGENIYEVNSHVYDAEDFVIETGLSGKGTEAEPYMIMDLDDLILFRNSVNSGETKYNAEGVYVALGADIDMAEVDWSVNIGDGANVSFDGIFDGNDHVLKNLTAIETAQVADGYICSGLFGCIGGSAVVKNLTIENVTIDCTVMERTGNAATEPHNVGVIVGFAWFATGSVENVKVTGDIKIDAPKVDGVGGIVGYDYYGELTVKDCSVVGNDGSYITGAAYVGGVIGYASSNSNISGNTVENVDITGKSCVGGVAGLMLGSGKAVDNTVKNVELTATHENWQNSAAAVIGTISGGGVTVSGSTVEGVNATALVGSEWVNKPTAPVGKVEAKVGDTYYATWEAALAAAQAGATVELLAPIVIAAGEEVTIDLAGKTVVYNSTTIGEAMITNRGTLTINDSVDGGVINYNYTGANDPNYGKGNYTISNGGTLTVNGGKITIANLRSHAKYPIDNNNTTGDAVLVINGGHLYNYNTSAIRMFCNSTTCQNSVTVNGGLVEGYNAIWMQNPNDKTVNGNLTVNGGEIKSTAAAYVNGTSELKAVNSGIYCSTQGGTWSADSAVNLTGGTFNENVDLAENAPANVTADKENATFNGRLELPAAMSGSIRLTAATLNLEGKVSIMYQAQTADEENVIERGVLLYKSAEDAATKNPELAYEVVSMESTQSANVYVGQTEGIDARDMGKSQFAVAYLKMANGTYIFGQVNDEDQVVEYSPLIYCTRKVNACGTTETVKNLCNAMMQYGAAAQMDQYSEAERGDLMNEGFDAVAFDASVLGESVFAANTDWVNGMQLSGVTMDLKGLISYMVKFGVDDSTADKQMYAEYTLLGETESMELDEDLIAVIAGIPAKDMGATLKVKAYYLDDNGDKVYGGELTYSAYEYVRRALVNTSYKETTKELAKALAMYVHYADEYGNNK